MHYTQPITFSMKDDHSELLHNSCIYYKPTKRQTLICRASRSDNNNSTCSVQNTRFAARQFVTSTSTPRQIPTTYTYSARSLPIYRTMSYPIHTADPTRQNCLVGPRRVSVNWVLPYDAAAEGTPYSQLLEM